ncbi:MucB/RseB C-terminal domain-containing protein [Metapseudomonas otitidis]|uniref:MucB/RseB C-terminal domain-containing protein n=1 Tax=Metapseudomonas otitidis TaxID=319939 RepID=UPI0013F61D45|nr:MucB/RseB C-terminal domain-containing protein [Pseudomonas otitidis]
MRALPLFVLLGGWLVQAAHAAEPQDWLKRIAQAEQQNFQGTFVYERSGSFSTHQIWHRVDASQVRERLQQLDGPAQEVVRVDGRTQCVSGALADQMGGQVWPARDLDAAQIAKSYEIRVVGESRVAGRAAVVLSLVPRDQHRYGFELHLDRETGLPLKSLMLNDKGGLLERFQFTQFETVRPEDAELQPGVDCQAVSFSEAPMGQASAWHSDWLPPGFSLSSSTQRRSPASSDTVVCLLFGDGLARFSVFLEPLHGARVEDIVPYELGPTVAVSRRLSTADGDVMVTVVGEIPVGTAERVALSMRSAGTAGSSAPQ